MTPFTHQHSPSANNVPNSSSGSIFSSYHTSQVPLKTSRSLISLARSIAEALPGAYGPLNIQVIYTSENERFNVIDINPRFGGGYPLAHAAGGRFTDWLIAETRGELARFVEDNWIDGLSMVRYRESLFEKV